MINLNFRIHDIFSGFSDNSLSIDEFVSELKDVCEKLLENNSLSSKGIDNAPEWLSFEDEIWALGEKLRPLVAKKTKLKKSALFHSFVLDTVGDKRFKKGRQSFALLLGQLKVIDVQLMFELIEDEEVQSHAISVLTKLKDERFLERIKEISNSSSSTLVKRNSLKYLKKFPKQ